MQHQHQYVPQPSGLLANAALSQDLLRQLQLGHGNMQAAEPHALPHQAPAGLHAYQQASSMHTQGPQSFGRLGAPEQAHVQVGISWALCKEFSAG